MAAGDGAWDLDKVVRPGSGAVVVGAANPELVDYLGNSAGETAGPSGWVPSAKMQGGETQGSDPPPEFHAWSGSSNYGKRVDCYAWGGGVLTTGALDPPSQAPTVPGAGPYRLDFNAASATAAIVAGVAVLVQSALRRAGKKPLSPWRLRKLFRTLGTQRSQFYPDRPIGVMPDLEQILRHLRLIN